MSLYATERSGHWISLVPGEAIHLAVELVSRVRLCWQVADERRALARLDERELEDIGITRLEAIGEADRAFWDIAEFSRDRGQ